jgi:uncharacterized protein YndB with AHSA1/START domain
MNDVASPDAYGALTEPTTLTIQRLLPGPIERVWAYLTESDLRRQWLASGTMEMTVGASFELVWRNDELTDPPGQRPPGFGAEHRMTSQIIELDPPRKLAFTFGTNGDVTFTLEPTGDPTGKRVLLTVVHRRLTDRAMLSKVSAGWHMHLDMLVARATGATAAPFWDGWSRLHKEYEGRLSN